MKEAFGDLWELTTAPNTVACITTNGYVNARGECVMGRGVARQAKRRYPGLARKVGDLIKECGNHTHFVMSDDPDGYVVVTFPTKHVWWRPADLQLIEQSARELKKMATRFPELTFYLPRPGCANGGRNWEEVRPVLESVGLPDNVVVIDRKGRSDETT